MFARKRGDAPVIAVSSAARQRYTKLCRSHELQENMTMQSITLLLFFVIVVFVDSRLTRTRGALSFSVFFPSTVLDYVQNSFQTRFNGNAGRNHNRTLKYFTFSLRRPKTRRNPVARHDPVRTHLVTSSCGVDDPPCPDPRSGTIFYFAFVPKIVYEQQAVLFSFFAKFRSPRTRPAG